MKKIMLTILTILIFLSFSHAQNKPEVYVVRVEGVINPIITQYILKGIEVARENNAECLIIVLNTPGGLDKSMRNIVEKMLNAPLPIIVFVAPSGARAASAGVFIGAAADILAMAPGTNIGAAHPVSLGGKITKEMSDKITNDAAAYMRSIAEKRGRNVKWLEKAVRKSVSITEKEAKEKGVSELIAENLSDLTKKIHNRKLKGAYGTKVLNTKYAKIKEIKMGRVQKFLHDISDPNIAYILMMVAIYGLIYELASPGAILPGVVGGICLILAFFALESLPINLAGLLLIIFAIILFIAEIKTPSIGALAAGGTISLILGSMMLFSSANPYISVQVSWGLILAFTLFTIAFFVVALRAIIKTFKNRALSGTEGIIGKTGIAKTNISPSSYGMVLVTGEDWSAEADEHISAGEKIEVVGVEELRLKVKKLVE